MDAAHDAGVSDILIHAITDGRDTSPTGGADSLATVIAQTHGKAEIATIIGRYYAMDRDNRGERNKLAWDAIVLGRGEPISGTISAALSARYAAGQTDEFILPMIPSHRNEQRVRDGDVVLFFNFRADRARQLSLAFLKEDFSGFDREIWPRVHYVTLTEYDHTYGCPIVFPPQSFSGILAGSRQPRGAETASNR